MLDTHTQHGDQAPEGALVQIEHERRPHNVDVGVQRVDVDGGNRAVQLVDERRAGKRGNFLPRNIHKIKFRRFSTHGLRQKGRSSQSKTSRI